MNHLNGEKILELFMKKKCRRLIKKNLREKKLLIKRGVNGLYLKWKGYDNSFSSSIKRHVNVCKKKMYVNLVEHT